MGQIEGFGVGLRSRFVRELLGTTRAVDWLEITPENWMFYGGSKRHLLEAAAERWPIVPHGVSLDVGGLGALDAPYLSEMSRLVRSLDAPFWSDHLCYSSIDGRPLHDLLPLPFTHEAVENVGRRAREAADRVGRPLLLENATFYAHMPGGEMTERAFLLAALAAGGCDLLLDVNNIYVNSLNHGGDPYAFIDALPLDRVRYVHVAGHTRVDDVVIDTHIGPTPDPVWALYRHATRRAGRVLPTLVEWDQEIPALDVVLDEVDRARAEASAALAEPPGARAQA
jgi:uncharacterized protein (UPF0276 family)